MTEDIEFLFDHQLIAALQDLVIQADKQLLLVSPFIDLDPRIKDSLQEKLSLPNFKLYVLFGKNEGNYYKSAKRDSLGFLKTFPNAEIRYHDRLHAKFYVNDHHYLMTSLNLYDYSLHNNIEIGMRVKHTSAGLWQKALDASAGKLQEGIEHVVRKEILGKQKETDPIEKIWRIFHASEVLYHSEAILTEESGVSGFFGKKKIQSVRVHLDRLSTQSVAPIKNKVLEVPKKIGSLSIASASASIGKYFSASQLAKSYGVKTKDVVAFMERQGLILGEQILEQGKKKGLIIKNYMGTTYIAYPETLSPLLKELRA